MIKDNPTSHKWTDQEKQVNCACCLLADSMKDCKKCPFYQPKVNTVSINYKINSWGHYKDCPVCVGVCVCP